MASQDPLKRLEAEREGEGDNPFFFKRLVTQQSLTPKETELEGESPFVFRPIEKTHSQQPESSLTGGARFAMGTIRGATQPLRALGVDPYADVEGGLAGMLGEFTGMAASFLPLYGGASVMLRGAGLVRQAPMALGGLNATGQATGHTVRYLTTFGKTPAGVAGARIAQGSVAFAGFEAFGGEEVSEAPMRVARGLAEGAIFEGMAIKAAQVWRRSQRGKKFTPQTTVADPLPAVPSDVPVHPLALKHGRVLFPEIGDSPEMMMGKLREIGSPSEQLHEVVARIYDFYMPGGHVVLPGLNQREVTQLYKALDTSPFMASGRTRRSMEVFRPIKGEDSFDVALINRERISGRPSDIAGAQTIEEVLAALDEQFMGKVGFHLKDSIAGGTASGRYTPAYWDAGKNPDPFIELLKKGHFPDERAAVSVFLHEISHHLQAVTWKRGMNWNSDVLPDFVGHYITDLAHLPSFATHVQAAGGLSTLKTQFINATEELIKGKYKASGWTDADAIHKANMLIHSLRPDYYLREGELMSRMHELNFLNPALAKQIAPDASRLADDILMAEAPIIRELMSRPTQLVFDAYLDRWISRSGVETVFTKGPPTLSRAQREAFRKEGWAPGFRAMVDGKDYEFLSKTGTSATLRNLDTGAKETVPLARLERPTLQRVVAREEELFRAIDGMLDEEVTHLPVNLRVMTIGPNNTAGHTGIQRAVIDTRDYLHLDTSLRKWMVDLPEGQKEALTTRLGQLNPIELDHVKALGFDEQEAYYKYLMEILEPMGYKGIVQKDNGFHTIFIGDDATRLFGDVIEGQAWGSHVGGARNHRIVTSHPDEWLKSALRTKGVREGDMDFYFEIAHRRLGERLNRLMDPEVQKVQTNVNAAIAKSKAGPTDEQLVLGLASRDDFSMLLNQEDIARSGFQSNRLHDGRIELRDRDTKAVAGLFPDEDHAAAFAKQVGSDNVGPPLGTFPGAVGHGGGGNPPPLNSQLFTPGPGPGESHKGWLSKVVDSQALFLSTFTALSNFAKAAENRGLGAVYNKVYLPTHEAMLQVHREIGQTPRDLLGGKSFGDRLQDLAKVVGGVSKKRFATVTGHVEALTKEEIASAGGLMTRAMTNNELRIAKQIEQWGLGNDIPRLMAVERLTDGAMSRNLEHVTQRMRQIQLSPEAQELMQVFERMPRFKSRNEVYDFLGLTKEERQVIKIINDSMAAEKDKFSIFAVSRYASAPSLKKGFKNGRDQFAFENKMTPKELEASKIADEIFFAAFTDSGLDPKRHLSGYWPHLRMWVQEGFTPGSRYLPDELNWVANRFRSGELSVYDVDPITAAYRHVRGLYMNKHFDPIMPEVTQTLERLKDKRVGRVMEEYVSELMGKPHASFEKLQGALDRTFKTLLGREADPRLAQNIVTTLAAATSSAVIPFRPALIARNFYESFLKVAPRVGIPEYFQALNYVVSPTTRKEAFNAAKAAGAIRPGTAKLRSVHAGEEMFGVASQNVINKYLHIFDKGFEWYQSADDWGRAIAFHAQKTRVQKHLDAYLTGKIDIDAFKSRAKINTFDPLDIQIAERELAAGNYDRMINHLGRTLSEESMTRYGYADHPAGWHSVSGRLFGQFGTWPVQYKDYLLQGISRGPMKDRAEFAAIHGAITGATIMAGYGVGVNLQNWTGMQFYTGGPLADVTIDVIRAISGSPQEKQLARRSLYGNVPVLGWMETGNPRSVFLPGSYFLGDLDSARRGLQDGKVFEGTMNGLGLRVIRAEDSGPLSWLYRF